MRFDAKPFLKWAGGKTQLLVNIQHRFPYTFADEFTYIEPFVGSGAVLFWVLNNYPNLKNVVINDINRELINAYRVVKKSVNELISLLEIFEKEFHDISKDLDKKKEYYYSKRKLFNRKKDDNILQAALLIFLNKTCFNGLYRVNKKNEFNVPIGSYKKPTICDKKNLIEVNKSLKNVIILNSDFEQTYSYAKENAIFYFDPPYKPLNSTSSFNTYSKFEFNDSEQIRLAQFCKKIDDHGYKWILSNSDVKNENIDNNFFDDLFKSYHIKRVQARRSINSNAEKRGKLTELLITN